MILSRESFEGTTASKTRPSGEDDLKIESVSKIHLKRPYSSVPSYMSMKSEQSMYPPTKFQKDNKSSSSSEVSTAAPGFSSLHIRPTTSCEFII
ncbi:hypothetical protein UPYG_G00094530 [Umbra pygmaea]|uniref:Uncharacterized protein n=1 Tax=Umbra pygmaea TaxID=75934 RepID=A0ABD0WZK0_UMBPY